MLLLAREWQQWEQADEARRKGATAIAMVFSMPPGTDPELVREAVRELAESDMANRRWVMALHTDEAHPHVHLRSEEHTSELQSLMRISYAVFCLKKKHKHTKSTTTTT